MLDADPSGMFHGIQVDGGLYHASTQFAYRDLTGEGKGELITADASVFDCRLVADDNGGLHAFYLGVGPEGPGLYYSKKPPSGAWGAEGSGLVSSVEVGTEGRPHGIRAISVCTLPDPDPAKRSGRVACFYAQEEVTGPWPPDLEKGPTFYWVNLYRFVPGDPDPNQYMGVSHWGLDPGPLLSAHRGHVLWISGPVMPTPVIPNPPVVQHLIRIAPDGLGTTDVLPYTFPDSGVIAAGPCSISVFDDLNYAMWWTSAPSVTTLYYPSLGFSDHIGYDVAFRHDNSGRLHRFRVPSPPLLDHSVYDSGAWSPPVARPMLHLADGFKFKSIGLDQAGHFTIAFYPAEAAYPFADPPSRAMATWEDNLGDQGELVMVPSSGVTWTNVANGNTFMAVDTLQVAGHGPQIDMTFYYNSQEPNETICGNGWRHSLSATLRAYPAFAPKVFVLTFPDGRRVLISPLGGMFVSEPQYGISLRLVSSTSGDPAEFEIEFAEKVRWNFNMKGKLTRIRDRDGNQVLLVYGDNSAAPGTQDVLLTATDPQGRVLSFTYDSENRLSTYSFGASVYSLTYETTPSSDEYFPGDALRLVSLPYAGEFRDWTFTYHRQTGSMSPLPPGVPGGAGIGARRCALSSIRTPSQSLLSGLGARDYWLSYFVDYNNFGRLKAAWEPLLDGQASRDDLLFSYIVPEVVPGLYSTVVTSWTDGTYNYVCEYERSLLRWLEDPVHTSPFSIAYDSRRNPVSVTDTGGFTATYTYSADAPPAAMPPESWIGDALMSVSLPGTSAPTLYRYHPSLNLVKEIVPFSDESAKFVYEYDSFGHLISVLLPGMPVATSMIYDASGRVLGATDPGGNATAFTFEAGTYGLPKLVKTVGAFSDDGSPLQVEYGYNSLGQVTSETMPSGASVTYFYDTGHRLTKMMRTTGSATADYTWEYDADDNVVKFHDPNGPPSESDKTVIRDARGRVTAIEDSDGKGLEATLNAAGRPTSVTGRGGEGNKQDIAYDADGRPTSITQSFAGSTGGPQTLTTTIEFTPTDQVKKITHEGSAPCPFTRVTELEYDTDTDLLKVAKLPLEGVTRVIRYDSKRRVRSEEIHQDGTFLRGVAKVLDGRDRPAEVWQLDAAFTGTTPTGRKTELHYDLSGNLTKKISPAGRSTTYAYDAARRLISTTDPSGVETKTKYAKDGQVLGTQYRIPGHPGFQMPTKTLYNDQGLPWRISDNINPDDYVENLYDGGGRLTRVTGPDGLDQMMEYTSLGRLTKEQVRRAPGDYISAKTDHDDQGNPKFKFLPGSTTDKWIFNYDTGGRLISMQAPEGVKTSGYERAFSYNANGKLCQVLDEDGIKTQYEKDALDRITKATYSKDADVLAEVTQIWDAAGNLEEVSDGTNAVLYEYNFANEIVSVAWTLGGSVWKTVEYDYDADGIRTEIRIKDFGGTLTHTLHYDLDPAGRISDITLNGESIAGMEYSHGFLVKTTCGNGSTIERKYDRKGRPKQIKLGGTAEAATIEYTYDKRDRPTEVFYAHLDLLSTFEYNDAGWLVGETHISPSGGPSSANEEADSYGGNESAPSAVVSGAPGTASGTILITHTYSYDDRGNRVSKSSGDGSSSSYAYDLNDRLTTEVRDGSTITYEYTKRGDLTKKTQGADLTSLEHNHLGLITHFSAPGVSEDYTYWPSGQRRSKTNALTTSLNEWYLPDGENTLADYTKVGAAWTLAGAYCHTGLDQLVARQDASSTEHYFFRDAQSSVHRVTGPGGATLKTALTDAWGNDIPLGGAPPAPLGGTDRWGFAGREKDTESGFMHYRARLYDPAVGRFLSRDPVWQHNLYRYALNLPTVYTDPLGRDVTESDKVAFGAKMAELQRLKTAGDAPGYGTAYNDLLDFSSKLVARQKWHEWHDRGVAEDLLGQAYAQESWIRGTYGESSKEHLSEALDPLQASSETFDRFEKADKVAYGVLWTLDKAGTAASLALGGGGVVKALCQKGFLAGVQVIGMNMAVSVATSVVYNAGIETAAAIAVESGMDPEAVEWAVRGADAAISIYGMTSGLINAQRNAVMCFTAGTEVQTSTGPVPIEKVREGDWVLSWDEATEKLAWSRVRRVFETPDQPTYSVTLQTENGGTETLQTTVEHPFRVEGRGWTAVQDLQRGDEVACLAEPAWVVSIAWTGRTATVYNFEVSGTHSYFVGQGGVLVHNKCGGETRHTIRGRQAHTNYRQALGANYDYNVRLPSGKKPDAVDWRNRIVRELKPGNARATARGERQVEGYRRELERITGQRWQSAVDTYKP